MSLLNLRLPFSRVNPFPQTTNMQQTIRNSSRKRNHWVELKSLWQNGEIAHYEQNQLLSQCFLNSSATEAPEHVFILERVERQCHADSH